MAHPAAVGIDECAKVEVRSMERARDRFCSLVLTDVAYGMTDGERQDSTGTQQARNLRNRHLRSGKTHCPVIAENHVETRIRKRRCFRCGMNESNRNSRGVDRFARVIELSLRIVEPGAARAAPCKRDRPLGTAATKFENVATGDITDER